MASPSVEDYIKAIYNAQVETEIVTTQDIAARVRVSAPAVTDNDPSVVSVPVPRPVSAPAVSKMLHRLTELRLIEHNPYKGVHLTEAGEKMALEIIRHHRLLELYLVQALGYGWDEVHQEAERLEHHISEEFEDRIDALLGYPKSCPHGDPIPTREGVVPAVSRQTLAQQHSPAHLTVSRVRDEDSALLRHIKELGLLPGTAIEFLEQEPFGGAYIVRVGDHLVRVAPHAAEQIFVGAERHDK